MTEWSARRNCDVAGCLPEKLGCCWNAQLFQRAKSKELLQERTFTSKTLDMLTDDIALNV